METIERGNGSYTKNLQRNLLIYSGLGALAIGGSVAIASIMPLYAQLKHSEERNLEFAARTRTLAVEEFLSRTTDIARQIASRTRARNQLEAYNQGQIERDEWVSVTSGILTDALMQSEEIQGITRLDLQERSRVQVGVPIPSALWQLTPSGSNAVAIAGPIQVEGESYVIVGAPILSATSERLGTDLVLFRLSSLQKIVEDYIGFGESGESILGVVERGEVELFFPLRNSDEAVSNAVETALKSAAAGEAGLLQPDETREGTEAIAFQPIANSNWGLIVKMDRQELYAPVQRQMVRIAIAIAILTLLGTSGMVLLLRPLTHKAIVETDELERENEEKTALLAEKTAALEVERHQRHSIREALRQMEELKASSRQVADACAAANASAQNALEMANGGALSVEETLQQMTALKDNVNAIAMQMQHLNQSSREIGTIAALVGNLSSQTNMLALNAAVEAVRAGDRGRGFSVIAAEIRKLADRSHQSADRINLSIQDIQTAISTTEVATQKGITTVESGVNLIRETAEAFSGVLDAIERVASSARDISLATHQQATAIQQVVAQIDSIRSV